MSNSTQVIFVEIVESRTQSVVVDAPNSGNGWTSIEEAATNDLVDDATVELTSNLPEAKYKGFLNLVGLEIPCYVLETGQRVIGRTSATEMLTGIKGGGGLEKYLGVSSLRPFIKSGIPPRGTSFV